MNLEDEIREKINDKLFEYGVSGFPHIANALKGDIINIIKDKIRGSK